MTRSKDTAARALDALIERFHAANRLRVWSLVITVFGDAIVPRGGMVGMATLQELTDRMRIAPGALRAALSRLAKDGWVERHRHGRRSYYHLTPESAGTFARAARRIYAAGPPAWDGGWAVAVAPDEVAAQRDARAARLTELGFARLSNGLFVSPVSPVQDLEGEGLGDLFILDARALAVPGWVLDACSAPDVGNAYAELVAAVAPLEAALARDALSPLGAMVARTLLIHEWRRVLLRDVDLPASLRPPRWSGEHARALVRRLYARLLAPSEAWLDRCDGRPDGPLPPPGRELRRRFAERPGSRPQSSR